MTRHLHIDRPEPVDIHELYAEHLQREQLREEAWRRYHREIRWAKFRARLGGDFRLSPFGLNRLRRFVGSRFDPARVVKAFCLAVAVFCIVYFPLRLLVAFL